MTDKCDRHVLVMSPGIGMKLIARSEALRLQGEELDCRLDEIQTEVSNEPADTALGALVKIKLCIEMQDALVGGADEPLWLPLLRSAYVDLQGV